MPAFSDGTMISNSNTPSIALYGMPRCIPPEGGSRCAGSSALTVTPPTQRSCCRCCCGLRRFLAGRAALSCGCASGAAAASLHTLTTQHLPMARDGQACSKPSDSTIDGQWENLSSCILVTHLWRRSSSATTSSGRRSSPAGMVAVVSGAAAAAAATADVVACSS